MDFLDAIVLGIVEGITEFLPISSTGHMIIASKWMGIPQNDATTAFEVIIQVAAILAVIANYRDKFTFKHSVLWSKVALAFMPIAVVGFLFKDSIKALFDDHVVGIMFIVGGIVFLVLEYFYKEKESHVSRLEDISYKQAAWIGFAQIFALIPGTSRAGSSIVGSLLVGLNRKVSAEFSFLLALPVLAAAAGLDFIENFDQLRELGFGLLGIGFVTAFIVAYLTMKIFVSFLQRFTFVSFGFYRIAFGLLLLWAM